MKKIVIGSLCVCALAAQAQDTDLFIAPAIELSAITTSGQVYQIEQEVDLVGQTNWQTVGQPALYSAGERVR